MVPYGTYHIPKKVWYSTRVVLEGHTNSTDHGTRVPLVVVLEYHVVPLVWYDGMCTLEYHWYVPTDVPS